jgi:hypothetical protein
MEGLPGLLPRKITSGFAYPNTGDSSYRVTFDSQAAQLPNDQRFLITADDLLNDIIYAYTACFVYETVNTAEQHQTFFCYFYRPSTSNPNAWNYCKFGQRAK